MKKSLKKNIKITIDIAAIEGVDITEEVIECIKDATESATESDFKLPHYMMNYSAPGRN